MATKTIRFLVLIILTLTTLFFSGCGETISTKKVTSSYLCLIVLDGFRPDYFSLADMPNLKKLMDEGVSYDQAWVGQLKNVTPPSHVTIATGALPRTSNVLGFSWVDPQDRGKTINITDWVGVSSGTFNRYITQSGITSIGTLYKKQHSGAKVAAISSDKFYAAAGLGADSADYILFNRAAAVEDYARTSGFDLAPAGVEGHLAPPEVMNDTSLYRKKSDPTDGDTWAVDLALKLFEKVRPEVMMLNLPETDEAGHQSGGITRPDVMSKVISNVDKQVGRLVDAYKKAGIYDRTLFIVTADHAMSPQMGVIPVNSFSGIAEKAGNPPAKQLQFDFYVPKKIADVAQNIALAKIPGIYGVYYKVTLENGTTTFIPALATLASISPDLDKTYRYLTWTYDTASSPDIFLATAENWDLDFDTLPGNHNTPTWGTQHIPLIISGPGVKKGIMLDSPARLVDIAPTVLTLMGIAPERMDGIVLADAIGSASDLQKQKQAEMNSEFTLMVKALQVQSAADIAALNAAGKFTPLASPIVIK